MSSRRKDNPWWKFDNLPDPPLPTPECFTDEEWAAYYEADSQAIWNKRLLDSTIKRDMCEDCTLMYQAQQIKEGKCRPYFGAITPLHRLATILGGENDPVIKRKSRSAPWGDDEDE